MVYLLNYREIGDEVYMAGGRIGIPELANILTVDFSQIEAQVRVQINVQRLYCFSKH